MDNKSNTAIKVIYAIILFAWLGIAHFVIIFTLFDDKVAYVFSFLTYIFVIYFIYIQLFRHKGQLIYWMLCSSIWLAYFVFFIMTYRYGRNPESSAGWSFAFGIMIFPLILLPTIGYLISQLVNVDNLFISYFFWCLGMSIQWYFMNKLFLFYCYKKRIKPMTNKKRRLSDETKEDPAPQHHKKGLYWFSDKQNNKK